MKIKLVLRPNEFTSFTSFYLESLWKEYFDIEYYNSTTSYDRSATIFAIWWTNANTEWPRRMRDLGYHIVVDNLWEKTQNKNDYHWMENSQWFWYNESLWWTTLGHQQYRPSKQLSFKAFMPVGRICKARDHIVDTLEDYKHEMLWSYRQQRLPNDTQDPALRQRYVDPFWYNSTYSSLVVETNQAGPVFISEKTFKPVAFYHPFQVIAMPGILKELKSHGFETYSNLFDESYDCVEDFDQRLSIIINNLKAITLTNYDAITQEKLEHNHNRFFDTSLVKDRIVKEIINPIIEYAHTH